MDNKLKVVDRDMARPWGGFVRYSEDEIDEFLKEYFPGLTLPVWAKNTPMYPKILKVLPGKRLSWQYHKKRGELWRVIKGPVGIYLSKSDNMPYRLRRLSTGQDVEIKPFMRHRLAGLEGEGLVAEIWVHTDPNNLSNEDDIVRLEDDFGRG